MKHINQSYLAYLSKVVVAATFIAMFSPTAYAYTASGSSTNVAAQTPGNSTSQQLLANEFTREKVETISQRTIRRRTVTTERRNQVTTSTALHKFVTFLNAKERGG